MNKQHKIPFDCWVDVNDALPEVPKGKHAVSVIVSAHNPEYEYINPGHGSYTTHCLYNEKDGFMMIGYGGKGQWDFYPMLDVVTHWMYKPEPVQIKENSDET